MSTFAESLLNQTPQSPSPEVEAARLRMAETMIRTYGGVWGPDQIAEAFHRMVRAANAPHNEIQHDRIQ